MVAAFWSAFVFLIVLFVISKLLKIPVGFKYDKFLLPLALFIPLSLVMAFVHEFGHALWGTIVGGRVTYIQVAYFEIYPMLRLTPNFMPGLVRIEGITGVDYGFFLLGGSTTTNIVAWLLALVLFKVRLGLKSQLGLKILWLFGLLDLPFYVLFPQIGLRHWMFIGGNQPEPLIGARMVGLPDPAFYILIVLTTLVLGFLYLKPLIKKIYCH